MERSGETTQMRGRASWIAYGVLLTVAIWLLAATFMPLWQPLLLAAVLAGTTHGWHRRLSRRLRDHPRVAASLMTLGLVLLVLIPLSLVGAVLIKQALDAIDYVSQALQQGGLEELGHRLPDWLEQPLQRFAGRFQLDLDTLSREAAAGGWRVVGIARALLESTSRAVFGLVMMLIAYFALLVDGDRLVRWLQRALPLPEARTAEMFDEFRRVSRSVLGSTVISAAAQAATAALGYFIAGVPNALFFAALTGLVAMLPILGTPLVALPLAGLLLATGHIWQSIFLALYTLAVISTVDNVVKPLVVRGGTELNGALVFFALIGGLLAFGAIGIIVGPLAVSFILSLVRLVNAHLDA